MGDTNEQSTGRWREALGLIDILLSTPQEGREQLLSDLAKARPELHARVRALLDADAEATRLGFMKVRREPDSHTSLSPDMKLGPYRIMRELGKGGMGEVWLARRDDGLYEGEVAIKSLHPFFAHGVMRDRFLREAQLLGKLAHPNIARLLDAGIDNGMVFIVLEYVRGEAIDVYCDARSLDVAARLELFAGVCAAVANAHSQPDRSPGHQALQHPRDLRGRSEAARFRHRQDPRARCCRRRTHRAHAPHGPRVHACICRTGADPGRAGHNRHRCVPAGHASLSIARGQAALRRRDSGGKGGARRTPR